jgi:hypothetical protein
MYFEVVASLPAKACSFDWHYLGKDSAIYCCKLVKIVLFIVVIQVCETDRI